MKVRGGAMKSHMISNFYSGIRSEFALTKEDKRLATKYLKTLGADMDRVIFSDVYRTAYDEKTDSYTIGTDVKPFESPKRGIKNANQRISIKGTIAHEVIGHREAHVKGWTQYNDVLEEVQASIRAARFAPDLSSIERLTLLMDARARLGKNQRLKDVRHLLHIEER